METPEEAAASNNNIVVNSSSSNNDDNNNNNDCAHAVTKGKRTKRQRLLLLAPATTPASPASSSEFSGTTTEEEEDMANCLILLAQGHARDPKPERPAPTEEGAAAAATAAVAGEKFTSRRYTEATTTTNGKVGFYVYECKTCNKCFPSFQALGGHRASHKKPKLMPPAEDKKAVVDDNSLQISMNSSSKSATAPANNNNSSNSASHNKARVHECSICGSEFSSGQALGGHMRRHRPIAATDAPEAAKKERNVLSLDLNLPAPSDDDRGAAGEFPESPSAVAFPFESKQPLVFSASALVDCHY